MKVIKLKELSEQLNKLSYKPRDDITWEDIDPIRNILEDKCFKIDNEGEAKFIIRLMERLFNYEFYNNRQRIDAIDYSIDWGYMCFARVSGGGTPDDFAKDIFCSMKIDACYKDKVGKYYEEVKIRELEIYRGTDVELLINKFFEDGLI